MKFDKNIYYDTVAYMQGGKTWITFIERKVKRWPKDMIAAALSYSWPEIGWHGSSGGPE